MYKQVIEPGIFGRRPRIVTAMFCDGCGIRIRYSSASNDRHLCEKCYKAVGGKSSVYKAN